MKKGKGIFLGLVLIGIGVILILNVFNIIDVSLFFKGWWTLIIIIPSLGDIISRGLKISNIVGLLIGIGLLLVVYNVINFDLFRKLIIPILLILIGFKVLFKNIFGKKIMEEIKQVETCNKEHFTSFGSMEFNYNNEKFLGGNVDTVFGSAIINLNNAKINGDVVIKASTIFGKTIIKVGNNVNVKVTSTSIFGGTQDMRNNKGMDNKYTVYINGTNLFGGLEIDE